jgi:hypothetical protein
MQISQDSSSSTGKGRTLKPAKSLNEYYDLVKQAIDDLERRANLDTKNKILFTEEEPDYKSEGEIITFSLVKREPGAFGQGAPFESKVRNLRPILRENVADPENPGYRLATLGYWHDNLVRFTCWAKTNKTANDRALWFEDLMENYSWWFKAQGVDRCLFWERGEDQTLFSQNNKWYGRPINYFVRTEKVRVFSEKTLEELVIQAGVSQV